MTFKVLIVGNHAPSLEQITQESKAQLLQACGLNGRFNDVEFVQVTEKELPDLEWIKDIPANATRSHFYETAQNLMWFAESYVVKQYHVGLWFEGHSLLAQDLALFQEKEQEYKPLYQKIRLLKAHSQRVSFVETLPSGEAVKKSKFTHAKWFCV